MQTTRREALADLTGLAAITGLSALSLAQPADPTKPITSPITTATPTPPPQPASLKTFDPATGEYILPPLPYKPEELEPHIDKATMEIHHGKHHAAYVAGANKALKELAAIRDGGDAGLIRHWARELSFHLAGHANHTLFWNMLAPNPNQRGGEPAGALATAIRRDFGSLDKFIAHFKANALQVEGGGWGWLVLDTLSQRLMLIQMQSQQDRFIPGSIPILGIDVWEHAYYLKYQNKRADYINAFMNVIHWRFCEQRFEAAM